MLVEVSEGRPSPAILKVIGMGGAGGNAVNRMLASDIRGVEFLVANTDIQALGQSACLQRLQIGASVTGGLGSGGDPELGRHAAEEDIEQLRTHLAGADMVFIAAGMGGGTGTGASPIVAQIARELGILTVAIVTKPFTFEGRRRMRQAEDGLEALRGAVDTLIIIPNQRLLHVVDKATPLNEALRVADDVLTHATKGISEIITVPGLINVDFADVRSVMSGMGNALMGMGFGRGPDRARQAADMAISSPLLEDISICGAQGILVNFMGGEDMTLAEVDEASSLILQAAGDDANVIFGAVIDPALQDEIRVTLIATGFGPVALGATGRAEVRGTVSMPAITPGLAAATSRPAPIETAAAVRQAIAVGDARAAEAVGRVASASPAGGYDAGDGVLGPARPIGRSVPTKTTPLRATAVAERAVATVGDRPSASAVPVTEAGAATVASPLPEVPLAIPAEGPRVGSVPDNVLPLVWKKNARAKRWVPQARSPWQRALSRDQLEVPSFLRKRQKD
jgi:cell division protein FtsZ